MTKNINLLNPYLLLGVNIQSTIQEVKKSYYGLALLCHPDRGGVKDDMNMIHQAYQYVMEQINNINKKTYEEYELEFKDWNDNNPIETLPTIMEIRENTTDFNKKFNIEFKNKCDSLNPSLPIGYGPIMDKSEYKDGDEYNPNIFNESIVQINEELDELDDFVNITNDEYVNIEHHNKHTFDNKVVVYQDTNKFVGAGGSQFLNFCDFRKLETNKKLVEEFPTNSESIKKLNLDFSNNSGCDYYRAFTNNIKTNDEIPHRPKTLEELIDERNIQEEYFGFPREKIKLSITEI